jgi:hypothetical protein
VGSKIPSLGATERLGFCSGGSLSTSIVVKKRNRNPPFFGCK